MFAGLSGPPPLGPYPPRPPSQTDDEITTIFVVGFPDDMSEREFQNMFIFSPGFEAATLKIPSHEEETTGRKQIIGFAKFRSRLEALEARDILTGRKVDAEKGCILKAEMAKKNLHTKRGLSVDYSSNNVYSYQTHVQHYNRRFGNPAAVASSALQDPRGDRIQGPDFAALSMPAHGRVHAAIFDYYPTATPPDLPLHGHAQGMDRSPYLLDKEVPGTMGLSRSTSRLETTLEDLRENPHIDLLIGSKDRAYSDRFSYNIVPGHHHHHHNSSPSLMISSHSTQSLGSADDYALLPRLPSSQTLGGGPHITSPPSSSLPSGVSSPYMRTALNSYTSEEDLKALFGTTQAALNLTTQRP